MAFPFDPNAIKRNLRAQGFNSQQAAIFTHLALDKLRELYNQTNQPVTLERIAEAIKQYATEEVEREKGIRPEVRKQGISIIDDMEANLQLLNNIPQMDTHIVLDEHDGKRIKRFKFDDDGLEQYFGKEDPYHPPRDSAALSLKHHSRDLITALCARTEIAVELGKQLRPEDLVTLYATSRMFHDAINEHLLSSMRMWIAHRAPEAGRIFKYKLYRRHLIPDPAGRTWGVQYEGTSTEQDNPRLMRQIRTVPGLRYLQLVLGRDRCCRQIVAIMARNGFLMPTSMHRTLLRLWLLMDVPTTGQRQALLRNTDLWTDQDLYNAQMLFLKLSMMFNDPIYGPLSNELVHVALGQKGLYPLWQLLLQKKFTTLPELLEWKVRYNYEPPEQLYGGGTSNRSTVYGVPIHEVGTGHLEGWGLGDIHLQRPDELVPVEAIARGLELDNHLVYMMLWGYIDFETGENIVPTEQDMYISDEETTLSHMDTTGHWKKKHALKKRFMDLSPLQQQQIMDEDEDDRLRALAWTGDTTEHVVSEQDEQAAYSLDDEIKRGYIVRPRNSGKTPAAAVPAKDDTHGWEDFVNAALTTVPADLTEEQALRAQAHENYHNDEIYNDLDWAAWLAEHEAHGAADAESPCSDDEDGAEDESEDAADEEDDEDDEDDEETIILDDPQSAYEEDSNGECDDEGEDGEEDGHTSSLLVDMSEYFAQDTDAPMGEQVRRLLEKHAPELVPRESTL